MQSEQVPSKSIGQESIASISNEKGGIAIPAIMWFAGVPFFFVLLLWFIFFRG